ncbi:hypothetical protein GGX14DRAFT_557502 [Mycena pura]|uniref:Uncharacterized protein n=1 Tax=Mycena pura TaxID=153505 RepID=A0AAD6YNU7_9AGAR|nr:hypothetical protein GGX14DRAFT_557502 [Mycena pura]
MSDATAKTTFVLQPPLITIDIAAGICKRNAKGKVVLPSGLSVPHTVPGPNLRARIVSWHAANSIACPAFISCSPPDPRLYTAAAVPSSQSTVSCHQDPTSNVYHAPVLQPLNTVPASHTASSASIPDPMHVPPPTRTRPVLSLSAQDRIAALESQIAALRTRRPDDRTAASFVPETRTVATYVSETVKPSPLPQPAVHGSIDQPHLLALSHRQPSPAMSKIRAYAPSLAPHVHYTPPAPYRVLEPQLASVSTNKPLSSSPASFYTVKTPPAQPVLPTSHRIPDSPQVPTSYYTHVPELYRYHLLNVSIDTSPVPASPVAPLAF